MATDYQLWLAERAGLSPTRAGDLNEEWYSQQRPDWRAEYEAMQRPSSQTPSTTTPRPAPTPTPTPTPVHQGLSGTPQTGTRATLQNWIASRIGLDRSRAGEVNVDWYMNRFPNWQREWESYRQQQGLDADTAMQGLLAPAVSAEPTQAQQDFRRIEGDQGAFGTAFNESRFAEFANVEEVDEVIQSLFRDYMGMAATVEHNQQALQEVAAAFATDLQTALDTMRERTETGFEEQAAIIDREAAEARAGYAGAAEAFQQDRLAAAGVYGQSLAASEQIRQTAERQYADMFTQLSNLRTVFNDATAWLEAEKQGTLGQLVDTTVQQLESTRTGLREAARMQTSQELSELQAMGFSLDSPAALSVTSRILGDTREQIGQAASAAYSTYVDMVRQTNTSFAELGTNMRTAFEADLTAGLQALGVAGTTLTAGYEAAATQDRLAGRDFTTALDEAGRGILGVADGLAEIGRWAAVEHGQNLYTRTLHDMTTDQLEMTGQQALATITAEAVQEQFVMESPFVMASMDARRSEEQWQMTQVWNNISVFLGAVDLVRSILFTGPRGGHMPEPDTDSSSSWISGGTGMAGAITSAAIIKSDRKLKKDIHDVSTEEVVEKVTRLPVSRWRYRDDPDQAIHIGPMAQDFHDLFHLGGSDKSIAVVDAFGVAMAAIKGLTQQVNELKQKVEGLEQTHAH